MAVQLTFSDSGQRTALKTNKYKTPRNPLPTIMMATNAVIQAIWLTSNQPGSPGPLIDPYLQGLPEK